MLNIKFLKLNDFCSVQAPACHELTYPQPLNGARTCTRLVGNVGWQCAVTCNDGYLIRGIGKTNTVTCNTNFAWNDADIVTACVSGKITLTVNMINFNSFMVLTIAKMKPGLNKCLI